MTKIFLPAIWVIVLIVGLPQLAETTYSPVLPDIAKDLLTSVANSEYLLTIYLFGFAVGAVFWGNISDYFGRKPTLIAGLSVFFLSCIGCYASHSILLLMLLTFIQAFGGSAGSVLGQAMCRDTLEGKKLGDAFAVVSSVLSIFPAIGPIIGGIIAEYFGWRQIFIVLGICSLILIFIVNKFLNETLLEKNTAPKNIFWIAKNLLSSKKILAYIIIIGGCHGLIFSYYAEAPFYLISNLGLSHKFYGISFIFIALSTFFGGVFSKILNNKLKSETVLYYALKIILINEIIFNIIMIYNNYYIKLLPNFIIQITIIAHMIRMFGVCMANSNSLALGLKDYNYSIGTASSLFSFFYCLVISLTTFGIGKLHNGSLIVMPLYFLAISAVMFVVYISCIHNKK